MRLIETESFAALTPEAGADPGGAPMLQWVKIADLVVDDTYQRPVYGSGRKNVRRIAEGFRWSKFAPVIVAPVAGGKYAIIDGQHRTTAAALVGIESVPAQVIIADPVEQASAFKSINGQVTQVNRLSLLHASIAAGDADAIAVDEAARAGGALLLKYPKRADDLQPGETIALGTITDGMKAYGRDVVVLGLRCVTETEINRVGGGLSAVILRAVFWVIGCNAGLRWDGDARVIAAFQAINLPAEAEEARVARRQKGTAVWEVLAGKLLVQLEPLKPTAAPDQTQGGEAAAAPAPSRSLPPAVAGTRVLAPRRVQQEVLTVLAEDPSTPPELAQLIGIEESAVREALAALTEAGQIKAAAMPAEGWRGQTWRVAA